MKKVFMKRQKNRNTYQDQKLINKYLNSKEITSLGLPVV